MRPMVHLCFILLRSLLRLAHTPPATALQAADLWCPHAGTSAPALACMCGGGGELECAPLL
jgi:hypothetical protein